MPLKGYGSLHIPSLFKYMPNKKLRLRFVISAKYDIDAFSLLVDRHNYSKERIGLIASKFPELGEDFDIEKVKEFVKLKYKNDSAIIQKNTKKIEKKWKEIDKDFFTLASTIFYDCPFPDLDFTAHPSIWPMCIRDTRNKRVSFPYDERVKDGTTVIAHELLHVAFYNYLWDKFPSIRRRIANSEVWDFSEVLNVLIQNTQNWLDVFGVKIAPYPKHEKLYIRMSTSWQSHKNIDQLIEEFLL